MFTRNFVLGLGIVVIIGQSIPGYSSTTPTSRSSRQEETVRPIESTVPESEKHFQQGKEAVDQKNYTKALQYFKMANREDHNNPDILNMIAFTSRKLGNFDDAFAYYDKALKLRPDFPEAREYLAEAHIQAALKELKTLRSYGSRAEEQSSEVVEHLEAALESAKSNL